MKESDLNTIINNSFKEIGFSHKISDPIGGYGIQNPFDGFSVIKDKNIYWETKLIKNEYGSFNFNIIEDHQIKALTQIKNENKNNICLILVGYYIPRKLFEVFAFDIELMNELKSKGKNSLLKKEIMLYKDKAVKISKKKLDCSLLLDNVIKEL